MKGKLIKENNGYTLFVDGKVFGDTDGHQLKSITNRLSLKNCQAIERDYDLDELASHNSLSYTWLESNEKDKAIMSKYGIEGFKEGFQKCLELLGDKKYSEMDMVNFSEFVSEKYINQYKFLRDKNLKGFFTTSEILKEYRSLQQTEWDVEVEMVKEHIGSGCYKKYPKSDDEGCLILKKYKNG